MANLQTTLPGIHSPNPFWLASAPPTDKAYNVNRAFEAGWGGVVWKTLGEDGPPVVNVNGPRYGALLTGDRRVMGFNNIELITDRDAGDQPGRDPPRSSAPGRTARWWCR
jgi:dihydropyrimidine dehydrogenase (NAD+) subunit PreA